MGFVHKQTYSWKWIRLKLLIISLINVQKYVLHFIANVVVLRTYCSAATWERQRTTVMAFLSALQATGFILGPGVQLAVLILSPIYFLLS